MGPAYQIPIELSKRTKKKWYTKRDTENKRVIATDGAIAIAMYVKQIDKADAIWEDNNIETPTMDFDIKEYTNFDIDPKQLHRTLYTISELGGDRATIAVNPGHIEIYGRTLNFFVYHKILEEKLPRAIFSIPNIDDVIHVLAIASKRKGQLAIGEDHMFLVLPKMVIRIPITTEASEPIPGFTPKTVIRNIDIDAFINAVYTAKKIFYNVTGMVYKNRIRVISKRGSVVYAKDIQCEAEGELPILLSATQVYRAIRLAEKRTTIEVSVSLRNIVEIKAQSEGKESKFYILRGGAFNVLHQLQRP